MNDFEPPPYRHHPLLASGHLQTITSVRLKARCELPTVQHRVSLPDGDSIVLHEDRPPGWKSDGATILLVHGLVGCHAAPYMVRLMLRFYKAGYRVFRMDLRGCGAGADLALGLSHAGRSDDLMAALSWIAQTTDDGTMGVVAVSLGANQLLRGLGRIGQGLDPRPDWLERLDRTVAVSPPVDLRRCSDGMDRWWMWPYNRYFIRLLLDRVPRRARELPEVARELLRPRPRTMRELDERITAPVCGFENANDYYEQSSAGPVLSNNPVPTLILTAADDPIVPVGCFRDRAGELPEKTRLLITRRGGHVGYIDRARRSWMDEAVWSWFRTSIAR